MEAKKDLVTQNYLQFCYNCQDAHECTTEEICLECWSSKGIPVEEEETLSETKELLQQYAE